MADTATSIYNTFNKMPVRYVRLEIQDFIIKNNKKAAGNTIFLLENKGSIGARIDFNINRLPNSNGGGLSTAQIKVYNLSDETFERLANNSYKVLLRAGYFDNNGDTGTIFNGDILTVLRTKNMTEVVTTLYCNTNLSVNTKDSLILTSLPTVSLNNLLAIVAKQADKKLSSDKFHDVLSNVRIDDSPTNVLNNLGIRFKFNWWVENDNLIIRKIPQKKAAFKFTPETGLLKPPMRTEMGVDIECFLQPTISPSDLFELDSKFSDFNLAGMEFAERVRSGGFSDKRTPKGDRYTGTYSILTLIHEGSTHINTWFTRIVGQKVA